MKYLYSLHTIQKVSFLYKKSILAILANLYIWILTQKKPKLFLTINLLKKVSNNCIFSQKSKLFLCKLNRKSISYSNSGIDTKRKDCFSITQPFLKNLNFRAQILILIQNQTYKTIKKEFCCLLTFQYSMSADCLQTDLLWMSAACLYLKDMRHLVVKLGFTKTQSQSFLVNPNLQDWIQWN